MEIISIDTPDARNLLLELVQKRGRTPEHNADWFLCLAEGQKRKPVIAQLDSDCAVLAFDDGAKWYIHEEPLAQTEQVVGTIRDFASALFETSSVEKVIVELKTSVRQELIRSLPPTLRRHSINYTMSSPVYDLKTFDSSLPGKQWKSLRNARNAFYKNHRVEVVDARTVETTKLHDLVDSWKKTRPQTNRTYDSKYHTAIDHGFRGFEGVRAMLVDGKVAGLNGGWAFPHKPGYYYSSIGLHDFVFRDMGAMLYLEDLLWIQEQGYSHADMAGGEEGLNHFKNQFHPSSWYKTHVFSISRG